MPLTREKAEMLDSILKRFTGNETVRWSSLKEEFKDKMHHYYVTENNIKYLLGEGMLETPAGGSDKLRLSDKGFATLADIDILGYVAQVNDKESRDKLESERYSTNFWLQIGKMSKANNKGRQNKKGTEYGRGSRISYRSLLSYFLIAA